jgi:acyl carrier protein
MQRASQVFRLSGELLSPARPLQKAARVQRGAGIASNRHVFDAVCVVLWRREEALDRSRPLAIDRDAVLDIIAEEALVERTSLTPEATLESLGIASLDIISIVFALEERFGLTLEQSEFEGVATLGGFVDVILERASIERL